MKKTPWFSGAQLPVRAGVYEVEYAGLEYQYFDGTNWHYGHTTPAASMTMYHKFGHEVVRTAEHYWRGLACNPATRQSLKGLTA